MVYFKSCIIDYRIIIVIFEMQIISQILYAIEPGFIIKDNAFDIEVYKK